MKGWVRSFGIALSVLGFMMWFTSTPYNKVVTGTTIVLLLSYAFHKD